MPKLSIICPCHNAEDFIEDAIKSTLAQSFKDFELFIIDNACTDKTIELAKNFKDKRIKFLKVKEKSLPKARNAAIEKAKGKYIALLDADDIFYPKKFEREIAFLDLHPEYIGSYSAIDYIDRNSMLIAKSYEKLFSFSGEIFLNLLKANIVQIPSPIYRKETVTAIQGFDENISFAEDWDFHLKMAYKGPIYFYEDANCAYRKHPKQMSLNYDVKDREEKAFYLLNKNLENLSCYLKKFKDKKLKASVLKYKSIEKPYESLGRKLALFLKSRFTSVSEKEIQNTELLKNRIYSNLYYRLAKEYRRVGDIGNSKRCIKECLKRDPRRYLDPLALTML